MLQIRFFSISLFLSAILFYQQGQAAFDFSPITYSLQSSGPGASASFTVTNLGESKTPVQVNIVPRNPDLDGKEDYKESKEIDDQFRIYPAQIILKPNEQRTIRVTWVGNPKIDTELSYRIIAEEFPIDVDDPNKVYTKAVAKVGFATRYIGSLYVTPVGAKADLKIEASAKTDKTTELILDVENKGTLHQVLKSPKLLIEELKTNKKIEVSGNDMLKLQNQNILAGKKRRFVLPWPKDVTVGPIKVVILSKE